MAVVPAAVFGDEGSRVGRRIEMKGKAEVAVEIGAIRTKFHRAAIGDNGVRGAALVEQDIGTIVVDLRERRGDQQGMIEGSQSIIGAMILIEHRTEIAKQIRILRLGGDGLTQSRSSIDKTAGGAEGVGDIGVELRIVGLKCQSAAVGGDGIIDAAKFQQNGAKIVMGGNELGTEGNETLKAGDGLLAAAECHEGVAEDVESGGRIGTAMQGVLEMREGLLRAMQIDKSAGEVGAGVGIVGAQSTGMLQKGQSHGWTSRLQEQKTEKAQGVGVVGLGRKHLTVERFGGREIGSLMVMQGGQKRIAKVEHQHTSPAYKANE